MCRPIRVVVAVVGVLVSAVMVSAADLEEIQERGFLTVISFPHQASEFIRTNLEAGPTPEVGPPERFVGLDVDLMVAFADSQGVKVKIRRVSEPSYGALIPDLLAGRGDVIASSFSITEERMKVVNFSDPYFSVYKVVVAPAGAKIDSLEKIMGKKVAVIEGSSHHELLRELGVADENFVFVPFTNESFAAVLDGEADYTLQDSLASEQYLKTESRLEIKFRLAGEDSYGIAVPKESTALLAALNDFLEEERASGRLAEAIDRHIDAVGD
jgi:ABC-type amino acid transport substrate-binding protein